MNHVSGLKLKLARGELGLTQVQLAKRLRINQANISRYETEKSVPTLRTFVRLARGLRKPAVYFLRD